MIRECGKHGLIGFDRFIEAVLLDETFRAIQLFDDVHTHADSDSFLSEVSTADTPIGGVHTKKHYIPPRLRVPNGSRRNCSNRQLQGDVAGPPGDDFQGNEEETVRQQHDGKMTRSFASYDLR